jgi:hypothetical protein
MSFKQKDQLATLQAKGIEDASAMEWQQLLGADYEHFNNWFYDKVEIPFDARDRLWNIANELGIDLDRLLQLIGVSLQ